MHIQHMDMLVKGYLELQFEQFFSVELVSVIPSSLLHHHSHHWDYDVHLFCVHHTRLHPT